MAQLAIGIVVLKVDVAPIVRVVTIGALGVEMIGGSLLAVTDQTVRALRVIERTLVPAARRVTLGALTWKVIVFAVAADAVPGADVVVKKAPVIGGMAVGALATVMVGLGVAACAISKTDMIHRDIVPTSGGMAVSTAAHIVIGRWHVAGQAVG